MPVEVKLCKSYLAFKVSVPEASIYIVLSSNPVLFVGKLTVILADVPDVKLAVLISTKVVKYFEVSEPVDIVS